GRRHRRDHVYVRAGREPGHRLWLPPGRTLGLRHARPRRDPLTSQLRAWGSAPIPLIGWFSLVPPVEPKKTATAVLRRCPAPGRRRRALQEPSGSEPISRARRAV